MREKLTKLFGSHLIDFDILPDNPVIIDAGACVGMVTKELQLLIIKEPAIFAIEPNRKNIIELKEIENIVVIEAALVGSKEKTEMRFYDYDVDRKPEWGNVTGLYTNRQHTEYMVDTINLQDLLRMIPLETINYIKMDIEGSEWDVVSDMNEDTAKRIEQISMEIHSHQEEIIEKLESLGYEIFFEKGELYAVRKEL